MFEAGEVIDKTLTLSERHVRVVFASKVPPNRVGRAVNTYFAYETEGQTASGEVLHDVGIHRLGSR
jgi:hypothetical protein